MREIVLLRVDEIHPKDQPRKHFENIEELAASIKAHGLIEPVTVRPAGDRYELVCGERRWRAAKLAGLTEIEAIVTAADEKGSYELSLIENLQRENLTPAEEGRAYLQLAESGYKQEEIARLAGKTQSYISHKINLLKLPDPLLYYLEKGALTENHIRQIATLKGIYPPALLRKLGNVPVAALDEEGAVSQLLYSLRPEEEPVWWPPTNSEILREGGEVFLEYVSKHNFEIPQWEAAAFWWGSMAAEQKTTVASLALILRAWAERYNSALFWSLVLGKEKEGAPPTAKNCRKNSNEWRQAGEWWGYWSDLKHSGSLGLSKECIPLERLEKIIRVGSLVPPSSFQPWAVAPKEVPEEAPP